MQQLSILVQGQCGASYAFSAIGALEGVRSLANNGDLVQLSEQNIIDCSGKKLIINFMCIRSHMDSIGSRNTGVLRSFIVYCTS